MKTESRQITLAIHTWEYAVTLKNILEREGLSVTLQNVNLQTPQVSAGVRVRIYEADLPKALRIIENPDIFGRDAVPTASGPATVLVPVDFSPASYNACRLAFDIASVHHARILLLHAYIRPGGAQPVPLSKTLDFNPVSDSGQNTIPKDVGILMSNFIHRLREEIKHGDIAAVPFSGRIAEALPEEAIVNVAKEVQPMLIVMGTHGADSFELRIMGSVTAEVLDTCRFPVFAVPGNNTGKRRLGDFSHVLFFAIPDQQDIVALDAFIRMFGNRPMKVTLLAMPTRARETPHSLGALTGYCREHYPNIEFEERSLLPENVETGMDEFAETSVVDILCVPNKKKNLLARFFNPTLAHRLIFITDKPMLVIPV